MHSLEQVIATGVDQVFSDVHITGGHPLVYRKNGVINFDNGIRWTHEEVDQMVQELLTPKELEMLRRRLSVDIARSIHQVRVRINVFNTVRGLSLSVRLLPGEAPLLKNINVHPTIEEFCKLRSGLVLICGPTGSGKSTTIAAMIEAINRTRFSHIVTLEDPIEYRFQSKKSFIEQRELGTHMVTFEQGLLDVLREAPDVIVVGELREPETIKLTLNASESGHLVIATLHGANSEDALYRLCNSFPPEGQDIVRTQLASTLVVLLVQKLVYMERAGFRVPLMSILKGNTSVKGLIRDNKFTQIETVLHTSKNVGMFTIKQYKEYLDTVEYFAPPSSNFKPTEEATSEIVYRSPLLDGHAAPGVKPQASRRTQEPDDESSVKIVSEPYQRPSDSAYVLDEELPMQELLSEMYSAPDKLETLIKKAVKITRDSKKQGD